MDYNIRNTNNIQNSTGVSKMENKLPTFQEQVDETIRKILERAEREVPEYGDFAPVAEYFDNFNKESQSSVGKYALRIYKMPKDVEPDPKQRYVEAAAYAPSGDYKADFTVAMGYKDDIIKQLKSKEFPKMLNEKYGKLLSIIED